MIEDDTDKSEEWFETYPEGSEAEEWLDAVDDPTIMLPECRYCLSELQELESTDPPTRWFRNKFCLCSGQIGITCEPCIRREIMRKPQGCNVCGHPWKPEAYRQVRSHLSRRGFRRMLESFVTPISVIYTMNYCLTIAYRFGWPYIEREIQQIHKEHLHKPSENTMYFILGAKINLAIALLVPTIFFSIYFGLEILIKVSHSLLYRLLFRLTTGMGRVTGIEVIGD